MASLVPIEKVPALTSRKLDAILIDDDPLVHAVWKMSAKTRSKSLEVFFSIDEFNARSFAIEFTVPIYVDSSLGGGVKGEEFAKSLHEQGFSEVYLATGFSADRFISMPWLRGIVGKESPWS